MKRKIAFISEHASPLASLGGVDSGGQNVYVAELAKHLASGGHHVDIFTRWEDPKLPKVIDWENNIRVIHVKAGPIGLLPKEELLPFMPEFKDDMIEFITSEKGNYNLIHANFFMSGLVAMWIKEALEIPFVITFHALGFVRQIYQGKSDKFPPERIEIEKQIVQYADAVIAECPQDKSDLIEYYDTPVDKITIIPCGFSAKEFYPINKEIACTLVGLKTDEKILLQLGRMVPRKGVDNVVRSLGKLKNSGIAYRLVVVGGESDDPNPMACPEIARLLQIARAEGVEDMVTFVGRKNREMLKYYYCAADIFISTPWYEPFGITPLESMACGTPVIGSNVGGIKYSVLDGKTGFLVPSNDPDALASKVHLLISNPGLHQQMKKAAIQRVKENFTWQKVASLVADLYKQIQVPALVSKSRSQETINKKSQAA
ncbi:glycosyltransferase family 1 protein [Segetibacter sp.]|jgi:D-inositol-3-phosphate glycosyltransferase|uniref:glycosyltransferase family 4 protein n=1 Tax=Segetibacter sp. TaxID=2231182 RepID=UPI002615795F|nr:glycosyltransferase family 1 protein [Segetibacter sp.]MCW3080075.1 glycosyl transferase group 1 [Segetibacter sp.]